MDIDYSTNDFIDINNQLFQRSRNNMGKNTKLIRDLDDDDKAKGEKNLLLYGSELVNNLKQINYTFQQIERYVFIKSKITKKTIKKVIEKGPKSTVKDIRKPIEETTEEEKKEETELGEYKADEEEKKADEEEEGEYKDDDFRNYIFITRENEYDENEYKKYFRKLRKEQERIRTDIIDQLAEEEIDFEDIKTEGSGYLNALDIYLDQLIEEGEYLLSKINKDELYKASVSSLPESEEEPEVNPEDIGKKITKIQSLVRGRKGKETASFRRSLKKKREESEERKREYKERLREQQEAEDKRREEEGLTDEEPEIEGGIPTDLKIPPFGADTSDVKTFLDIDSIKGAKRAFKNMGFESKTINKLSLKQIRQIIDAYDQGKVIGSGRYRGGAGKKGMKRGIRTPKRTKKKTEAKEPEPEPEPESKVGSDEEHSDEELELIDEKDPRKEAEENEEVADEVDSSLVEVSNMKDTTPSQTYIAKANELMMNLIQFIGRTTVLYITRIDKNINYLDEDQVKLIFDNASQLKPNLDMLQYYKNLGGALIKETIYKQLTSETNTLYNKINDNIRNYKKLTNYKVFEGAGINHYKGGYFIQSDNPFIRHSTTKRFL